MTVDTKYEKLQLTIRQLKSELSALKAQNQIYSQREELFRKSEAHLHVLHETIPDLIWVKDMNGVYLSCNQKFERFFGAKESEIVGKTDYEFVSKELADFFRKKDRDVIAQGIAILNEEEVTFAGDGHKEILETIKTPMFDGTGQSTGILGISRIITQRKFAEAQLKKAHDELEKRVKERTHDIKQANRVLQQEIIERKIAEKKWQKSDHQLSVHLQNTPVGVISLNTEFCITEWNPASENIFGFTKKEAVGIHIADLIIPKELRSNVDKVFQNLLSDKSGARNINENITKSGQIIICDWYNTVLYDADGQMTGFASLVNDITQLKLHEKQLLQFEKVIEQADEEVVITDPTGIIQYVNPSFEKNMGHKRKEIVGKRPSVLKSGLHNDAFYKNIWTTILDKKIWKGNIQNKRKNGTILLHDMVITPIVNSENDITAFVSIRRNITEQVKMEQQMQQSRKMEAIGTLAGGIAHDFNNILSGIFGYAQLADMNLDKPEKAKNYITQVTVGAKRATELVQQILTFSRQSEHKKNALKLYLIIKEATKFLRSSIPATIEIKEKIYAKDKVLANPTQIHQIVMNLCTNAYHAMKKKGGILTVSLEVLEVTDSMVIPGIRIPPDRYLNLKVSDTGSGMTSEVLTKIFEPYFTTKDRGEGTGLGLAVVKGIIEDHNGYVTVRSEVGKGSTFKVYLPVLKDQKDQSLQEKETDLIKGGSENIMVIDDDEAILSITKDVLEKFGYQVTAYLKSPAALDAFEQHPLDFDLIITDMTMPGIPGDDFSYRALKIRKDIPIILCTGYNDNINEIKALDIGIKKYLSKPVESKHLLALIRKFLDESKPIIP